MSDKWILRVRYEADHVPMPPESIAMEVNAITPALVIEIVNRLAIKHELPIDDIRIFGIEVAHRA